MDKPIRKSNVNDALQYARIIADEIENDTDEFLTNILEIRRTTTVDFETISVQLYRTIGGPTCYLDTATSTIECYWGTDNASVCVSRDISQSIEDAFTW